MHKPCFEHMCTCVESVDHVRLTFQLIPITLFTLNGCSNISPLHWLNNASICLSPLLKSLGYQEQVSRVGFSKNCLPTQKDRKFATMKVNGEVVYMTQILTEKNALSPKVFYQTKSFEQTCISIIFANF